MLILYDGDKVEELQTGEDMLEFPSRPCGPCRMQSQMALLQFMNAGREQVAVPSTVHCDHLIQAYKGAKEDVATATRRPTRSIFSPVMFFPLWHGIFGSREQVFIHQVVLGELRISGGMMVGTDSHTPNAGGFGHEWLGNCGWCRCGGCDDRHGMGTLKMPRLIGVHLKE